MIEEWVGRRWADARKKLATDDPEFVRSLTAAQALSLRGALLPMIRAKKGLSKPWIELLDSTTNVVLEAEMVTRAAEQLNPSLYEGLSKLDAGRLAYYNVTSWILHDRALTEQVKRLIAVTVKVYLQDRTPAVRNRIKDKHTKVLNQRVAKRFEKGRLAIAHGVSVEQSTMQAVTEDRLWDGAVVFSPGPSTFLDRASEDRSRRITRWHEEKVAQTGQRLATIGEILVKFEVEFTGPAGRHS